MERDDFGRDVPSSGRSSDREIDRGIDRARERSEEISEGIADRARHLAGSTQDRLADVGSSVREKASDLKESLADALDSGANKLRSRSGLDASGEGALVAEHDSRLTEIGSNVAGGMAATASWLRSADIENMKLGIEKQVREHPARSLLVAVGLGYLIGKAFRH